MQNRSENPPIGCAHSPACPNRRACRKYSRITDRELAQDMMAIDEMLSGLRHFQRSLEITAACPVETLSPLDRVEFDNTRVLLRSTVQRLSEAFSFADVEHVAAAVQTIH